MSHHSLTIGAVYDPEKNNAAYRVIFPLKAMERRGHRVIWPTSRHSDIPMSRLRECDVVHCHRRGDRVEDLRKLARSGIAITFDNDDNFLDMETGERGSGMQGRMAHRKLFRSLLDIASFATLCTTTNEELAAQYRAAGIGRVVVIPNWLSSDMFGFGSRSKHEGLVVGWVAGLEHETDLGRVPITSALQRLLDRHDGLSIRTAGVRVPLNSSRYKHFDNVMFQDLLTFIGQIDIGIAPLADTAFNRCRSDVKLKEYGAGGAAWLASPVGPYRSLGEQEGGRLVPDAEWFEAVDRLLREPRTLRKLRRRALRWARSQTVERLAAAWERTLEAAAQGATADVPLLAHG